jgi:hypothetical protein
MTHYNINYAGLSQAEADHKAMEDIVNFHGQVRVDEIQKMFRAMPEPLSLNEFAMAISFIGIKGYPCEAWHRRIWPDRRKNPWAE